MACDAPVRQCLIEHIRPYLAKASDNTDKDGHPGYLALCPGHDDTRKSLGIHEGKYKRIVWCCGTGCSEAKVRHGLIGSGIRPGCLPRSAAQSRDLEERIWALLESTEGHAAVRLRILALLDQPGGDLPRGAALDALACRAGVSRREAYRALGVNRQP